MVRRLRLVDPNPQVLSLQNPLGFLINGEGALRLWPWPLSGCVLDHGGAINL